SNRTNAITSYCSHTPRHRNAHAPQTGFLLLSCLLRFLSSWQQEFSLVSSSCARLSNCLDCTDGTLRERAARATPCPRSSTISTDDLSRRNACRRSREYLRERVHSP